MLITRIASKAGLTRQGVDNLIRPDSFSINAEELRLFATGVACPLGVR